MISLIIPTMWKPQCFLDMLPDILEQKSIYEVIIINNDVLATPKNECLNHEKIVMVNNQENIYVAPAWNMGAKIAKSKILGFFSDDVIIDQKVFDKVNDFMTEDMGMIGILCSYLAHENPFLKFYKDGNIDFMSASDPDPEKRPPPIGIGNLFFVNKADWKDIPEQIKIFHGEAMQWNRLQELKNSNYMIVNCRIKSDHHVTWRRLSNLDNDTFSKIQLSDQKIATEMGFIF